MPANIIVNIDVDDLEAAIAFYEAGLGLTIRRRLFDGSVAEMEGAGIAVFLMEKEAGTTAAPGAHLPRNYRRHWTPVHLDFVVEEIGAAVARAERAGATRDADIGRYPWGDVALMADPFGNGFCLIAFNSNGYDAMGH